MAEAPDLPDVHKCQGQGTTLLSPTMSVEKMTAMQIMGWGQIWGTNDRGTAEHAHCQSRRAGLTQGDQGELDHLAMSITSC